MTDYGNTPPPPSGEGGATPPPPAGGNYGSTPPPVGGGYGGVPAGPPPGNNLVIAIVSLICCWPIGIPAVVFAAQVNGKWNGGDQAGAMEAAAKAKKFATIALVLGIIVMIIYGVLLATGAMSADASTGM